MTERITSARNPRVVAARKLARNKERHESGLFLLEGPTIVREALEAGIEIVELFAVPDDPKVQALAEEVAATGARVYAATPEVVAAVATTTTPQPIVASARIKEADIPRDATLVVILDNVRDPGNAGTLCRTAVAAGVDAVVFTPGAVDPWTPKTIRASAGTIFHLPVVRVSLEHLAPRMQRQGVVIVGADADAATAYDSYDWTAPTALVLGNEAWGLPPQTQSFLDERVAVVMPGRAESLNVGIAGSVLLFEAVRQRRAAEGGAKVAVYPHRSDDRS